MMTGVVVVVTVVMTGAVVVSAEVEVVICQALIGTIAVQMIRIMIVLRIVYLIGRYHTDVLYIVVAIGNH